jgi:hypothetical protein
VFICFDLRYDDFLLTQLLEWDRIKDAYRGRLFAYCIMGFCIGFFVSYTTRFVSISEDRRKDPRFVANTACRIKIGGFHEDVKLKNISIRGMSVKSAKIIAIDKDNDVDVLINETIQMAGKVASVKNKRISIRFSKNIGYDTLNGIINLHTNREMQMHYAA